METITVTKEAAILIERMRSNKKEGWPSEEGILRAIINADRELDGDERNQVVGELCDYGRLYLAVTEP